MVTPEIKDKTNEEVNFLNFKPGLWKLQTPL